MKSALLAGKCVGISISESSEMEGLGLGKEHLEDAMAEIARHLLACGVNLVYGGDLRAGGFTELLFEIVNRYRRNSDIERISVRNFLAWPVHATIPAPEIEQRRKALEGFAELVLLSLDGKEIQLEDRPDKIAPQSPSVWEDGLTAMRRAMSSMIDARIVLGGRTKDFRGRLPGIAEEALLQIESGSPLFVLGGFGGCSFDIVEAMRLGQIKTRDADWKGIEAFRWFGPNDLKNGLTPEENLSLANTVHVDQAVALILRGLLRLNSKK
jgi:hypothetical protein